MAPKTVDVPEPLRAVFMAAEEVVGAHFAKKQERPDQGTIDIEGERYVLLRAASLSERFFRVVREIYGEEREREADDFARNILFDLAHGVGRSDAEEFASRAGSSGPIERLSAGPVHFAYTGWARVRILPSSAPTPDDDYLLIYDHPYSFESDAWLRSGTPVDFPVCIMNSGYSSGWCEASFGLRLVATEVLCRARGDEACRFIMAPPGRIEARVEEWLAHDEGALPARRRRAYRVPDLFARKTLEERLHRARDELELRVAERTAALELEMESRREVERQLRQSQKMEAVGRLSGGIAHDFNNVLGVIMGCVSVLEARHGEEELVGVIRESVTRAAELTRQLLAFSRSQILRPAPVDLDLAVEESVRLFRHLIGEQIEITVEAHAPEVIVRADAGGLQQVLLNLGLNARDAMPEGGRLTITTGREPGHGVLRVEDTGVGMDEETIDRIFDPFFTTKVRGEGTGLGLSTAHGIIHQFGGTIEVESAPGQGASFLVRLPLSHEAAVPARPAPPRAPPLGEGVVLVVEDNTALRQVVEQMLREGGHQTIVFGDPREALERIDEDGEAFDLLLTDVVMPGMSGKALADEVLARRPDVRVLFMTGHADDDVLRRGGIGADETCLYKPFSATELLDAVRRTLFRA